MILVTGGTGLVGAHLLFTLVNSKKKVRAIYRNEKKFDHVKRIFSYYTATPEDLFNRIEWVEADLNDIPSLTDAFDSITHVYHCAALVSFEPDKFDLLQKTNIEGTANIVNFCVSNGIKKLCYVSSVATIGEPKKGQPATEKTEWNPESDNSVYALTKYGAELEVWRGTQEGLDAVIINPGVIIGPGIWHYGSGSIIKTVAKGLPYYTSGSMGYVGINDVVTSMITAMESTIINARFICVTESWSYKKFLTTTALLLGVKPPNKEAKPWLLQLGWRLDWLRHALTGKRRKLTGHLVASLQSQSLYDNTKIKETLSITFTSLQTQLETTCSQYIKDNT
ncbi:NAD-dependent epimerase/dehydratase family protein [Bizionia saleffrena]|uniref:NAD-dependent epimerase/dehydratase family protein n=1 Tax=Bizionia saleffrena TaxID=291189 RepID=A0A8H2LCF8_9FLAO|nr:NAD-dependent epimerase/dehydratase family protein [Bizionia saleffrena]TYB70666.1 NAD-dependent epimerase/dehydratase family protein [Bizionia saleffrena]